MSNNLEAPRKIARMAMVELANALPMARLVYRDYAAEFGPGQTGTTVNIRRPVQFQSQPGPAVAPQSIQDGVIPLVITDNPVVHYELTTEQVALNDRELSERFAKPAARAIANEVERRLLGEYAKVPHWLGTPGQLVRVRADVSRAATRLVENGMPENEDVSAIMTAADLDNLSNDISRLPDTPAANTALREHVKGKIGDASLYRSNLISRHTRGAWSTGGTIEVVGAGQSVAYSAVRNSYQMTLNVDGGSNNITDWARAGDVFAIEGVFAVNPVTKQVYSHLRQFTVVANANTDGGGAAALTITPPIITSGPYQTVSNAPADNADIFVVGAATGPYQQNIAFHKNAFALAMIPLAKPIGAVYGEDMSYDGYRMRVTAGFDIMNGTSSIRLETLFGVQCINPELACRFSGTAA
jgi:hypothetical protein